MFIPRISRILLRRFGTKNITLKIDEIAVTIPEGSMLIDAIKQAKKKVPTLCYNPKISSSGGLCRVCLVDDLSKPGVPIISCRTPVKEGMQIRTDSEAINKIRETNKVLMLKKHPSLLQKKNEKMPERKLLDTQDKLIINPKFPINKKENLLPIAVSAVDSLGYLSLESIQSIASHVGMHSSQVKQILPHYQFLSAPSTSKTQVYLCNCHNCRMKGQNLVHQALASRTDLEVHRTSWLGVCVNDAPSAFVKRKGTDFIEYIFGAKLDTINDVLNNMKYKQSKQPKSSIAFYPFSRYSSRHHSLTEQFDLICLCQDTAKQSYLNVIPQLKEAKLEGRGGGGFPAYVKWEAVSKAQSKQKYVVCNADEGLPSVFKDWWILSNEYLRSMMIIGMLMCSKVVGSQEAVIYLRYEYRNLKQEIEETIQKCIGYHPEFSNITINVVIGGGSYIAGEQSALFESLEGAAPTPRRIRHWNSHSVEKGLFGHPTVMNNVETFTLVPYILHHGAKALSESGLPKLMCVTGDVKCSSLLECSLKDLTPKGIFNEMKENGIRAAEIGGITEPIILADNFERLINNNKGSLNPVGSIVAFNYERDLKEILIEKFKFMEGESCKQCIPCKEGSRIFHDFVKKSINSKDILCDTFYHDVAKSLESCANCNHGKSLGKLFIPSLETLKKL